MGLLEICTRLCRTLQDSGKALDYLRRERGLSNFTIDDLSIGYCNWNTYEELGINLEGRIVFPIRNIAGDVVSFGGRSLSDGVPKYLNGISTDIYDKSRVLYNLDVAYDYILSCGTAIVNEGYMDVASVWDNGIRNVVATCGTAMTRWHVRALKPYADRTVLLYDDDAAGVKARDRGIEICQSEGMPVFTVSGLSGMDPDEYIKIFGKESLLQLIDGAKEEKKR